MLHVLSPWSYLGLGHWVRYSTLGLVAVAVFETTMSPSGYLWLFSDLDSKTPGKLANVSSIGEGKTAADEFMFVHGWYLF